MTSTFGHPFVRLCVASALAYASYAMCRSPVLPLYARSLGAPPELVGFVVAASTITGVLLKFPAGALSDVVGRRTLLVTGGLVFAALPFSYLAAASVAMLVAIRFLHGSATAIFGPVAAATVSDLAPPARRGAWLGTYTAAQATGQIVGPVLGGALIGAGTFAPAFLASGTCGIGAAVLLAGWPQATPRAAAPRPLVVGQGLREVARDIRLFVTSAAEAAHLFVNNGLAAFLPIYASERLGLTTPQVGVLFGAQALTSLLTRPACGWLSDRLGRPPLIVAGLVASSLAILVVSTTNGFAGVLVTMCAHGAGLALTSAAATALVTDLARREHYGSAHGVFGTIFDVGDAAGPLVAGLIVGLVGYHALFGMLGGVSLASGLGFAWQAWRWRRMDRVDRSH